MFGFINKFDNVIWPPQRDSSVDILSVNPSSERILVAKLPLVINSADKKSKFFFIEGFTAKRMEIATLAKKSEKLSSRQFA